jgi:FkbM family methyltransferase
MQYYFRKKFFKVIFLFHKFFTKTTRPLKGFYGIYLTPAYHDKTFEYCFKGTYGTKFSDFLANITEELFFLDIGANQGLYSVLAGKNPAVKKIFSFEPDQLIGKRLTNNLKINQIQASEIISAAISNHTGELSLNTVVGHSGKSSLRTVKQENKTISTVKIIRTINHEELNKLIPGHPLNGIKIDVEGHEEVVIRELLNCEFFKQTQWIFCEIDEKWINPDNIYRLLRKEGFTRFERIGNHPTHYDVMVRR